MNTSFQNERGFTLIEAIITIVIIGIVAGLVGMFLRMPIQQYTDVATRAELTDSADTALRRIGRDLRLALPNSIRTPNAACMEYLPTITGGRYRADVSGNAAIPGSPLSFTAATASFDVLGGMTATPAKGDLVVVYNLGIPGADAYSGVNTAAIQNVAGNTITLANPTLFPLESPSHRFQVIPNAEQAVTYVCTGAGIDAAGNGTGTLHRLSNYGINPNAPVACPAIPAGASLLAQNVSACTLNYSQLVNESSGLIELQLSLTRNGETVSLYHEAHVSNVP